MPQQEKTPNLFILKIFKASYRFGLETRATRCAKAGHATH
jgi:hypothetical protein